MASSVVTEEDLNDIDFLLWMGEFPCESWTAQGLYGWLPQQCKNGPCGILAAYSAELLAAAETVDGIEFFSRLSMGGTGGSAPVSSSEVIIKTECPPDRVIVTAIAKMLRRCAAPGHQGGAAASGTTAGGTTVGGTAAGGTAASGSRTIVLRTSLDSRDPGKTVAIVSDQDLEAKLAEMIPKFHAPSGALLLLYSLVLTRGLENIRADIEKSASGLSSSGFFEGLIIQPFGVCSSELMGLVLRGEANGNFADAAWPQMEYGLLSSDEGNGLTICNSLRNPKKTIWILHGGDHYTLLWAANGKGQDMFHFNGLPPGGPRLCLLRLTNLFAEVKSFGNKYIKPEVGEIDDIVQADKTGSLDFQNWVYELVLALPDTAPAETSGNLTGSADNIPVETPGPADNIPAENTTTARNFEIDPVITFDLKDYPVDLSKGWRCRSCYETRFKTMCFGMNGPNSTQCCEHCGQALEVTGHSIWLPYTNLPEKWQRRMKFQHGPKIMRILETKWTGVEMQLMGDNLAGSAFQDGVYDFKEIARICDQFKDGTHSAQKPLRPPSV